FAELAGDDFWRDIGVLLRPMLGNGEAGWHPDLVEALDVVEEFPEALITAGLADEAAMQANGHHLGRTGLPLGIEAVETVLEEGEIFLAIVEARPGDEAHVIGGKGIGNNQLRLAADDFPI